MVDGTSPPLPGVRVSVVAGQATALELRNDSPQPVEALAPGGEPFLRVGPRGVEANVASPYWYQSGNPEGVGQRPGRASTGRVPRWRRVSAERGWIFYEHRIHPEAAVVSPEVARARRVATLRRFAVPLSYGARRASLEGRVEYRPLRGSIRARLSSPARPAPELFVGVAPGRTAGLLLQNGGREEVTVAGRAGEPFTRLGPRGAEVNLRSPTYADDRTARGETPTTPVDPRARPLWRRVDDDPVLTWLDSRTRYAPEQPPDGVLGRSSPTVLRRWSVPIDTSRGRIEVAGATSWVPTSPPDGASPAEDGDRGASTPLVLGVLGAVLAAALFAALRLRRREPAGRS